MRAAILLLALCLGGGWAHPGGKCSRLKNNKRDEFSSLKYIMRSVGEPMACFNDVKIPDEFKDTFKTCIRKTMRSYYMKKNMKRELDTTVIKQLIRTYFDCEIEAYGYLESDDSLNTNAILDDIEKLSGNQTKINFFKKSMKSCLNDNKDKSSATEQLVSASVCSMKESLEYCMNQGKRAGVLGVVVPLLSILEDDKCSNVDVIGQIGTSLQVCYEDVMQSRAATLPATIGKTKDLRRPSWGRRNKRQALQYKRYPSSTLPFGRPTGTRAPPRRSKSNYGRHRNFDDSDERERRRGSSRNSRFDRSDFRDRHHHYDSSEEDHDDDDDLTIREKMEIHKCVGEAEGFITEEGYDWDKFTEFITSLQGWDDSIEERDQIEKDIMACKSSYNSNTKIALLRQSIKFGTCFLPKFSNNCGFNSQLTMFFFPHLADMLPKQVVMSLFEKNMTGDDIPMIEEGEDYEDFADEDYLLGALKDSDVETMDISGLEEDLDHDLDDLEE